MLLPLRSQADAKSWDGLGCSVYPKTAHKSMENVNRRMFKMANRPEWAVDYSGNQEVPYIEKVVNCREIDSPEEAWAMAEQLVCEEWERHLPESKTIIELRRHNAAI